ncbi:hypothetical protein K438DRAFT_1863710 [Mycena galopus ATCC 62051]|nr:hypothetical protein K438DRAFT_1863710 [Mycena galopus ATCC 62051]
MTEAKPTQHSQNNGEKDDRYKRQQSMLKALATVGTFMAGVESRILNLTLGLGHSKLRTVGMCFAIVALINTIFASLYSTAMHVLYCKTPDEAAKCPGSGGEAEKERRSRWRTGRLQVTTHRYANDMIKWCGTFLVIGTCAGFIALILYFFARSSIGIGIFVVMIVFVMGACPMIWLLLLVLRDRFRVSFQTVRFSWTG